MSKMWFPVTEHPSWFAFFAYAIFFSVPSIKMVWKKWEGRAKKKVNLNTFSSSNIIFWHFRKFQFKLCTLFIKWQKKIILILQTQHSNKRERERDTSQTSEKGIIEITKKTTNWKCWCWWRTKELKFFAGNWKNAKKNITSDNGKLHLRLKLPLVPHNFLFFFGLPKKKLVPFNMLARRLISNTDSSYHYNIHWRWHIKIETENCSRNRGLQFSWLHAKCCSKLNSNRLFEAIIDFSSIINLNNTNFLLLNNFPSIQKKKERSDAMCSKDWKKKMVR